MKLNKVWSTFVMVFTGVLLNVSAQAQRAATATPTVVNGFVIAITVTDGGAGYTDSPKVHILEGGGTGAVAIATVVNGAVNKVIVQNAGSGYTVGTPTVTIDLPPSPKPPFSDGLVAYYPFNGNANDESGNAHHGVVAGARLTSDQDGNANSAYRFNGGSYIDLPIDINFKPSTISAWFNTDRLTTSSPSQMILFNHGFGQQGHGVAIDWVSNHIDAEGQYAQVITSYDVLPNSWHQVIVAYSDRVRAFVDGVKVGDVDYPGNPHFVSAVTRIGRSQDLYVGAFDGMIDDIRVYNRALSDQEVKDLYRYEAPDRPSLRIEVETVRVILSVKPTKRYQLESSFDLKKWTKVADPILATSAEVPLTFNVLGVGQYFRIYQVQ
ncbi:MAG: LamG domain-containing protein [Pedosphaera sp.]|nr:LamG domain-containing protein [Pedosphaera sp.]